VISAEANDLEGCVEDEADVVVRSALAGGCHDRDHFLRGGTKPESARQRSLRTLCSSDLLVKGFVPIDIDSIENLHNPLHLDNVKRGVIDPKERGIR